ncbi:MAG: hypothetical protein ABI432_00110 [Flavobacteriales bacterium]
MFTITCPGCQRANVPLYECYRVGEHLTCTSCFEREHPLEADRSGPGIARLADMDHCAFCGKSKADVMIKNMNGSPVCVSCSQNLISRPFPLWVKAFFAGVLLLVVVSIAWNWRFFRAHGALTDIGTAAAEGDIDGVLNGIDRFDHLLPEQQELLGMRLYWQGLRAMQHDSAAAALALFEQVHREAPGQFELELLMTNARLGAAFDRQDYDEFLAQCKKLVELDRENPTTFASIASAFACKYATSVDTAYRDSSLQQLEKARSLGVDSSFTEYEERILYRLASREIISRTAFHERFPNGWKP